MKELKEYLKTLPIWNDLTNDEKDKIVKFTQIKEYEKGNIIHSKDHECLGLIKVLSGDVRVFMMSDEGREITLYQMGADDLDVLSASCVVNQITFDTQMIADNDCVLLVVPAVYLSLLKENNLNVRCFIYEKLTGRFSDVMKTVQRILFTRIDSRIAIYLLDKSSKGNINHLYVTHEEIAREINTSREVASRVLKQLEDEGVIRLKRGKIDIIDKNVLKKYLSA